MDRKLEQSGARALPLLTVSAMTAVLAGCGLAITQQQVLARADRSLASHNYRAAAVDLQNLAVKRPNDASVHLKLAEAFLHLGRYVECEANLRDAQQLGVAWSRIVPQLSEALLDEGRSKDALDLIAQHAPSGAENDRLASIRGRALFAQGKIDEARAVLSHALAVNADDTQARIALARLLERQGDAAGAKSALDQAAARAPRAYGPHYALAGWYVRRHQMRDAHDELTRALELARAGVSAGSEPQFDELGALATLTDLELTMQDLASAEKHVAELHKVAAQGLPTLLLQARLAIAQNHPEDARTALEQVLARQPNNARAKMLFGVASAAAGDLGQAEMYLTAALASNPHDLEARRLLAQVQLREHKPQAALRTAADPTAALDADLLTLAGQASVMTGDLSDATQFLEKSERAAPQDKVRALRLAAAYLAQDRTEEALKVLQGLDVPPELLIRREILLLVGLSKSGPSAGVADEAKRFAAAHPQNMDALLLGAQALIGVKDVAGARDLIAQASRLDSRSARPSVALGALELSQGNRAAAHEAFQQALKTDPKSVGAELGEAQIALASDDRSAAIRHLERARELAPRSLVVRLGLSRLYLQAGQAQLAAASIEEARRLAPDDPNVQLLQGALALAQGNAASAIPTFEALTSRFPKSALLQADLARAYILANRAADARKASADAVRLDPKYWPAIVLETTLALDSGDLAGVPQLLDQLRGAGAPPAVVHSVSGDVSAREGNPQAALREYQSAAAATPSEDLAIKIAAMRHALNAPDPDASLRAWLQHAPRDEQARVALAQNLQNEGNRGAAMKEYETVLAANPNDLVALNNLAWLKLEAGDDASALTLARKAYALAQSSPFVADTFGWALVKTGNAADAVPVLRGAHGTAPRDLSIHLHYAQALLDSGAGNDARRELQAIAAAQPHGPQGDQARTLLAQLVRTARQ